MKIGKLIESAIRTTLLAPPTLAKYGTLRPEKIKLSDCENWIHIDPSDRRAVKKFIYDPLRRRISPPLVFWRDFLAKLEPGVALDVGVNYGECIFGARYHAGTRVYGFEANPHIIPYLRKSTADHPDADRITIVEGLISDSIEEAVPFYSDPTSSGTGSAVRTLNEDTKVRTSSIPSHTIDSVIPRSQAEGANLLFKMDIEGYETRAFGGFRETLDAARLVVGFVEFDTTFISEAGADAEAYYASLADRFDVHRLASGRAKSLVKVSGFHALPPSRADDGRVHTDLLLTTRGADPRTWLPEDWSIQPAP